jgi:hypothetical protein
MAFRANKFQQLNLGDSYLSLSERQKRYLEKSWCYDFEKIVFPHINEERFSTLYSDNGASRPNTPVNVIFAALILKEMHGLTDEELMEAIILDTRYQYALRTTSMEEQPISDRTFSRFRERLLRHEAETGVDLVKQEMYALSEHYLEYLGIHPTVKRMDSLMVAANCKEMSRLELFHACVSDMASLLHRLGQDELLKGLEKYLDPEDRNRTIYRCKPGDAKARLKDAAADAVRLELLARGACDGLAEYENLKRLIEEQVGIMGGKINLKEGKDIYSDSLQNPSEPDATYRKKGGKEYTGYVGNFVECVDEKAAIITNYDYRPNTYSDQSFCKDVIGETGEQADKLYLISDGAYCSMENVEEAAAKNIELVTTALAGGAPPSDIHSGFQLDKVAHTVVSCPMGYAPERFRHHAGRDSYRITFKRECCENCPNREKCKAKIQAQNAVVHISQKMIERAQYIEGLSADKYRELQRKRNGVEGIPSILRRRYHVDEMPVRGYLRAKLWFSFKIGAINARRMEVAASRGSVFEIFKVRIMSFVQTNDITELYARLRCC